MLIMVDDDRLPLKDGEQPEIKNIRFRSLGCNPLTGAVESNAATVPEIVRETLESRFSERRGRSIDHDGAASMERKDRQKAAVVQRIVGNTVVEDESDDAVARPVEQRIYLYQPILRVDGRIGRLRTLG